MFVFIPAAIFIYLATTNVRTILKRLHLVSQIRITEVDLAITHYYVHIVIQSSSHLHNDVRI